MVNAKKLLSKSEKSPFLHTYHFDRQPLWGAVGRGRPGTGTGVQGAPLTRANGVCISAPFNRLGGLNYLSISLQKSNIICENVIIARYI